MTRRTPGRWLFALLCLGSVFAAAGSDSAFALPCDDRDVIGPLSATGENAGQCRKNLLDQVDCDQLCSEGECPVQNPLFENDCINIAKQFTNLVWFKESRSCTVDAIHCLCRCRDPQPGRSGRKKCGNGKLDRGEECDPGNTALAASSRTGGPDANRKRNDAECPAGGECNADCTCGEPPTPTSLPTPTPTVGVTDSCTDRSPCGGSCTLGADSGICIANATCSCCPSIRVCSTTSGPRCCALDEVCRFPEGCVPCGDFGAACGVDGDCCAGLVCTGGVCED